MEWFTNNWIEIIGYIGSLLVAVSLTMSNIFKLRIINLVGGLFFTLYGFILKAYPVLIVNGFISLVDIYYLVKMHRSKDYFNTLNVSVYTSKYMERFLSFYKKDLDVFFPDFIRKNLKNAEAVFTLRNLIPAGLFIYEIINQNCIDIKLDYVTPEYRDMKNAKFLYTSYREKLKERGFNKIITKTNDPTFIKYLLKVGFKKNDSDSGLFEMNI